MAIVAVVVASAFLFYEDITRVTGDLRAAAREVQGLEAELSRLKSLNAELQERLVVLERAAQVKANAYRQVDKNVAAVEGELARLREQVAFYRGIVAETAKPGVVSIYSLTLHPLPGGAVLRYELVLTRMGKSGKVVTGAVGLSITGEGPAGLETLGHTALVPEDPDRPRFSFSHFQRLEGTVALPAGFTPRSLRVEVTLDGERQGRVEREYDWQVLVG